VHVPFPWEDDPIEIPWTSSINAKQQQSTCVCEEARQQGNTHQRMQAMATEDPRGDTDCESAGTERSKHHHVEGLPDAPTEGIVHTADWPESCEFAIAG